MLWIELLSLRDEIERKAIIRIHETLWNDVLLYWQGNSPDHSKSSQQDYYNKALKQMDYWFPIVPTINGLSGIENEVFEEDFINKLEHLYLSKLVICLSESKYYFTNKEEIKNIPTKLN